jgi:hypothetical protein
MPSARIGRFKTPEVTDGTQFDLETVTTQDCRRSGRYRAGALRHPDRLADSSLLNVGNTGYEKSKGARYLLLPPVYNSDTGRLWVFAVYL